jgi:hypothetical protein
MREVTGSKDCLNDGQMGKSRLDRGEQWQRTAAMQAMSGWAGSDETLGAETMKQVNCPMNRLLPLSLHARDLSHCSSRFRVSHSSTVDTGPGSSTALISPLD